MTKAMTPEEALQRAIQILGGPQATGALLGISRQAVEQWTVCPASRVEQLAEALKATGPVPTAKDLRPDLYSRKKR